MLRDGCGGEGRPRAWLCLVGREAPNCTRYAAASTLVVLSPQHRFWF